MASLTWEIGGELYEGELYDVDNKSAIIRLVDGTFKTCQVEELMVVIAPEAIGNDEGAE